MEHPAVSDLVSLLMSVAMADGRLDPAEERLIRSISRTMGLSERDFEEAQAMFNPTANIDSAYTVLGVYPTADDSEVKRAYRRLMSQHHPDKLVAKGLPEEMMKLATERSQEIRRAYERVMEARQRQH